MDANRSEAERRVRQAAGLIESAYRLSADLRPQDTIDAVRTAMIVGAEMAADDVKREVEQTT